ncbi:MAG: class II D-tagatose-bisphosphate aldolase, non-catalytic subunit [Bacillota bacterium]
MHPLQELIGSNGQKHDRGIYSCCSANEYVLKAALERGSETGTYVLIEATANQVNQCGGYTGMTPMDFMGYVRALARDCCFPEDRLLLGGDHLGPLTFAALPEAEAMKKAVA